MATAVDLRDFRELQKYLREQHHADTRAFVGWVVRAHVLFGSATDPTPYIVDAAGDKGMDAIVPDHHTRTITIVQAKYRKHLSTVAETKETLLQFATLPQQLLGGKASLATFLEGLPADQADHVRSAVTLIRQRRYTLQALFATTGRITPGVLSAAEAFSRDTGFGSFRAITGKDVIEVYREWRDTDQFPIPEFSLELESRSEGVSTSDGIESHVVVLRGREIAKMFRATGRRLFARNIRGFLGDTPVNRSITKSIRATPARFFFLNNGVTIVCSRTKFETEQGISSVILTLPQVINGQQTTRTLAQHSDPELASVRVLCRIYAIAPDHADFDDLVREVVRASNFQNSISMADLCSNDEVQVTLQRMLRQWRIGYLRKRETKGEARAKEGGLYDFYIKKEELAYAIVAADFDPYHVRAEKAAVWEKPLYDKVFSSGALATKLAKYHTMRLVQKRATTTSERTYMKWLLTHFMWRNFVVQLDSNQLFGAFVRSQRRGGQAAVKARTLFLRAAELGFLSALSFYNHASDSHQDTNNFMRSKGRHEQFQKFWYRSDQAKRRKQFADYRKKFVSAVTLLESELSQ